MKVSVVMLAYNHETMIGQAIESVLNQEVNFEYELVIGEDCSTDKTREVVQDYANRFPDKIRAIFHSENLGPRNNSRITTNEAKGIYIAFLDGDDYWNATNKLQTQVDYLDEHPGFSMCFHAVHRLYEDGTFEVRPCGKTKAQYSVTDFFDDFPVPSCSPMYRGSIMQKYHWSHPENVSGDVLCTIWNAKHGPVGYIDQVMGVYRIHLGGIFSMLDPTKQFDMRIRTLRVINEWLDFQYDQSISNCISRLQCRIASVHSKNARFHDAKAMLKNILKTTNTKTKIAFSREFLAATVRTYLPLMTPIVDTIQRWVAGVAKTSQS